MTASRPINRLTAILATGALCMPFPLCSDQTNSVWRSDKHQDGIQVFSREVDGSSTRAIKAEVDINAAFDKTVALLLDASQRPRWDEICAEATVHTQLSDNEDIIYVVNDLPWPVSDRDMVLRRQWSVTTDQSRAEINARIEDGLLPNVAGRIRVKQAKGVWTVVRTGKSSVRVSTVIHAEAGGPIPGWLMNTLSVQGPYKALYNIRHILESYNTPLTAVANTASAAHLHKQPHTRAAMADER